MCMFMMVTSNGADEFDPDVCISDDVNDSTYIT